MATFLNLYRKTVRSNNKEELARIADEVATFYKNKSVTTRRKSPTFSSLDPFLAGIDSAIAIGVISHTNEEIGMLSSFFSIPVILTSAEKPSTRIHVAISGLLGTFPVKDYIQRSLSQVGLSCQSYSLSLSMGTSFLQVLGARLGTGCINIDFFDFLSSVIAVGGINLGISKVSAFLHQYIFSIPQDWITMLFSYLLQDHIYKLSVFGVKSVLESFLEYYLTKFSPHQEELEQLPLTAVIPDSLTCNICHDILDHPVESLGFFFCGPCMERWISNSRHTHPVTGEPITEGLVSQSLLLHIVSQKYHQLALQ